MDYAALKTEIATDPLTLGYGAIVAKGDDASVATVLNASLTAAVPNSAQFRSNVTPAEVIDAIAPADFTAATALQVAKLQLILLPGVVDCTKANVRGALQGLFAAASQATKNALIAVVSRQGSRAEMLFGAGVVATASDVSFALRGAR